MCRVWRMVHVTEDGLYYRGHQRNQTLADPELRGQVCPRAEMDAPGSEYEGSDYSDGSRGSPVQTV